MPQVDVNKGLNGSTDKGSITKPVQNPVHLEPLPKEIRPELSNELQQIIDAWPKLSEPIKDAILSMVRTLP